jgi:hypothetical protein
MEKGMMIKMKMKIKIENKIMLIEIDDIFNNEFIVLF